MVKKESLVKWSEVLSLINNIIFVIFRDLPRALMIGIPLVILVFLFDNIAYSAVIGGHGIFNLGAVVMVSIIHNNAQETHCSF